MAEQAVPQTKIIKGYYLTGLGQEADVYYFKIAQNHQDFSQIEPGQVCLTFYQSSDYLTPLPALIRVDRIISSQKGVSHFLKEEKQKHYPLMPILGIYTKFDIDSFGSILEAYQQVKKEVHQLAKVTKVQLSLLDFMED
ncbi:hypothetical protein ACVR1G_08345 [Streptococcus dentasini]